MYLMTAHDTFVGIDGESNLVQLELSYPNLLKFVSIEEGVSGYMIQHGALADFETVMSPQGASFVRDNKYLCAEKNSATLVADRDVRGRWETFSLIAADKIRHVVNIGVTGMATVTTLRLAQYLRSGERGIPASPEEPRVSALTPEQARWLGRFTAQSGLEYVLLAHFRPEPGSRPTIYVQDPPRRSRLRRPQAVAYADALISKYLLHPDYYDLHVDRFASEGRDFFCVMQIGDDASDTPMSVAYAARGPQVTLIPDLHFWNTRGYFTDRQQFRRRSVPWEDRALRAFWRGSSTGAGALTLESIQRLPRFRLCTLSRSSSALGGVLDAKLTSIVQARDPEEGEKILALTEQLGAFSPHVPQTEFLKYRYQIDIDGNTNSWGFLLKLLTGSCVLKVASEWRQWYYDDLRAWEHYVPITSDLSDLEEKIGWCLNNDAAARDIGSNGLRYAKGIVFGTEMPRAASSLLQASRNSLDDFPFIEPPRRCLSGTVS